MVLLLILNNFTFYFVSKHMLIGNVEERSQQAAGYIRDAFNRYKTSVHFVEDMIGNQLHQYAKAVKSRLDPKADGVTDEELIRIRDELGIARITLLKREGDDIVGVRSSDPNALRIGKNTTGPLYEALEQLLAGKEAAIPNGQHFLHYWSAPIEHADGDASRICKWGFYYDGTTDYIIGLYADGVPVQTYDRLAGPNVIIEEMVANTPGFLEMTGFNCNTFGKAGPWSEGQSADTFVSIYDRPIVFGTYRYVDSVRDVQSVRSAIGSNRTITYTAKVDGDKVVKSFIPVRSDSGDKQVDYPYVIGVVYDYDTIRGTLDGQRDRIAAQVAIATLISVILLLVVFRAIKRNKDEAARVTQEAYIDEVNDMFTTIRGQRHDFLNHVQTMHAMLQVKRYDDLRRYTAELIGEIRETNDIIQIGDPAIAAIVQSKVVTAMDRKIDFRHEFSPFGHLNLGVKSVDIVKIIGNLVDNAFDEVMRLPVHERWVELKGTCGDGYLVLTVRNPGRTLDEEERRNLFKPGYSTKDPQRHSGIGLAVARERVLSYKGTIDVESDAENGTTFTVRIPVDRLGRG